MKKKKKCKWIPLTKTYFVKNKGWKIKLQIGMFEDGKDIVISFGKEREAGHAWRKTRKAFYISEPYWRQLFSDSGIILQMVQEFRKTSKYARNKRGVSITV